MMIALKTGMQKFIQRSLLRLEYSQMSNSTYVKNPRLELEFKNERYAGDMRVRADRYVFSFQCEDAEQGKHEWRCSFWVPVGAAKPRPKVQYKSKEEARQDGLLERGGK
jgi:hypothetical protein